MSDGPDVEPGEVGGGEGVEAMPLHGVVAAEVRCRCTSMFFPCCVVIWFGHAGGAGTLKQGF